MCVLETGAEDSRQLRRVERPRQASTGELFALYPYHCTHRIIRILPGGHIILPTGYVSIVCIFIRKLFLREVCHVQKMRVASARRNIRVGFRTAGTRARTKFLKTTYCTRNVQEMYRNVQDENVQRNVQELRRFGQKCSNFIDFHHTFIKNTFAVAPAPPILLDCSIFFA